VSHTCPLRTSLLSLIMIGHLTLSKRVSPYVPAPLVYTTCDPSFNVLQCLDPLSGTVKGHMFFGIMKVFRGEYIAMCLLLALRVSAFYKVPMEWG